MIQPLIVQRLWVRFALTLLLVAFAAALRIWPLQALGSSLVWLTFYPAVVFAAIFGGFAAGLLATALSCFTAIYLWPLLVAHPFIDKPADWLGMTVFGFTGLMISGVGETMRRAQTRVAMYSQLRESMDEGFCVIEMIYDVDDKPVDYRFSEINPAFEKQTGLSQALGKTVREMIPGHDASWFEIYGKVAQTGESMRFENEATALNRYYDVYAYRIGGSGSNRVGVLFKDVTAHKELQNKLKEQANTDSLTGCNNRRFFLEHVRQEFIRIRRYGGEMSILMLDLDHFKTINDRHGHQAGDKVLKHFAQTCKTLSREVDVFGRVGGEEFAMLLPATGIEKAFEIAERLYKAVAAEIIPVDDNCLHITTSIGIACLAEEDRDIEALISRADAALYKAKEAGRNRALA